MWLLRAIGIIGDAVQWFIGFGQRKIGRVEQQNEDAQVTINRLRAELDAANNSKSAADELSKHEF